MGAIPLRSDRVPLPPRSGPPMATSAKPLRRSSAAGPTSARLHPDPRTNEIAEEDAVGKLHETHDAQPLDRARCHSQKLPVRRNRAN